jgi:predicted lipid-binding transport protein (Tim44 family)
MNTSVHLLALAWVAFAGVLACCVLVGFSLFSYFWGHVLFVYVVFGSFCHLINLLGFLLIFTRIFICPNPLPPVLGTVRAGTAKVQPDHREHAAGPFERVEDGLGRVAAPHLRPVRVRHRLRRRLSGWKVVQDRGQPHLPWMRVPLLLPAPCCR